MVVVVELVVVEGVMVVVAVVVLMQDAVKIGDIILTSSGGEG